MTERLTCQAHGAVPWYIVCVHVLDGAPIAHYLPANDGGLDGAGEVLCARCVSTTLVPANADQLRAICCHCVETIIADRRWW